MEPSAGDTWFESLPSGWDIAPLRFMARFESGGTPNKGNKEFWDGEIPWVSPKDMKVDRIDDSEDHVTDVALSETSLSIVPADSDDPSFEPIVLEGLDEGDLRIVGELVEVFTR